MIVTTFTTEAHRFCFTFFFCECNPVHTHVYWVIFQSETCGDLNLFFGKGREHEGVKIKIRGPT